jgi:Ca2+/Na+ antiporter
MTEVKSIKSIKCTNCAAPLNLFGGGRVESITCAYCKSVLDLNDNYKVLTNFKNTKEQHKLPFDIGMKGRLQGIDYIIIGRITYATIDYPHEEWTDFLLFSALYGYAYLTYEEGHLIYSKRNRTFPNLTWSEIQQHANVNVNGKSYVPFDAYEANVTYVEGELTWIAKRHDKTFFIDLIAAPFGISVEKTKGEIEYYQAKYLESDSIYEAFNIKKEAKAKTFHALEPFNRPFLKSLSYIAYVLLFIIALFFIAVKSDGLGKIVKNISADNQAVKDINFTINSTRYLVELELHSPTAKALNNFNLQIHKDKKLLFALTPKSAYIFNEKDGKVKKELQPWDKKAKKVLIALNLEKSSHYQLSIKPIDMTLSSSLVVNIKEARSQLNYVLWFFITTLFFWLLYQFLQWRYKLKVEDERGLYLEDDSSKDNSVNLKMTLTLMVIAVFIMIEFNS